MKKVKKQSEDLMLLGKMLKFLKSFKKELVIIIICVLVTSGVNILLPLISKTIMDNGLVAKNVGIVFEFSLITLILVIFNQLIGMLETYAYTDLNTKYGYVLFKTAFRKMLKLKISYFDSKNFSEITNNLTIDVNNVSRITDRTTFLIVGQLFQMVSGIIGLCMISWKLMLLVLCIIPLKFLIVKILAKLRKRKMEDYISQNRDFYSWFGDCINGIKEIKLWNLKALKIGQFIKKQHCMIQSNKKLAYLDYINQSAETILYQILTFILYICGAMLITNNTLTIGGLFAFTTYTAYITGPISLLINLFYNYSSIIPSAKRLFAFFDEEIEGETYLSQKVDHFSEYISNPIIQFDDVSFGYDAERSIIQHASFKILPGEKVAIIGHNGSGKTTLLNLLLRFYEPNIGKITFDDVNIKDIKLIKYRKIFSVVSQDPYLFNTSIKDNIDLSGQGKSKLYEACQNSGAADFISRLPNGYETIVGRNGAKLSGGEKQKVSVARVFMNESPVIVFDEATSNFDNFSDDYINKIIFSKLNTKTVIVITHKSDILKYMDKIIEVRDGSVIEHEKAVLNDCKSESTNL